MYFVHLWSIDRKSCLAGWLYICFRHCSQGPEANLVLQENRKSILLTNEDWGLMLSSLPIPKWTFGEKLRTLICWCFIRDQSPSFTNSRWACAGLDEHELQVMLWIDKSKEINASSSIAASVVQMKLGFWIRKQIPATLFYSFDTTRIVLWGSVSGCVA